MLRFGSEVTFSVLGLLAGRTGADSRFSEAVDSLDIAVFSEATSMAHDPNSFSEESCKAGKAIKTFRLEGNYKFFQYLP